MLSNTKTYQPKININWKKVIVNIFKSIGALLLISIIVLAITNPHIDDFKKEIELYNKSKWEASDKKESDQKEVFDYKNYFIFSIAKSKQYKYVNEEDWTTKTTTLKKQLEIEVYIGIFKMFVYNNRETFKQ